MAIVDAMRYCFFELTQHLCMNQICYAIESGKRKYDQIFAPVIPMRSSLNDTHCSELLCACLPKLEQRKNSLIMFALVFVYFQRVERIAKTNDR